jgi:hypothetical protein
LVLIVSNTSAGKYALTAVSVDSTGAMVTSAPIDVLVESADSLTDLKVDPPGIFFGYVGQTLSDNIRDVRTRPSD